MKQINVFLTWFWKISHIFKWNTRKDKVTNKQKRVKSLVALFCNLFWFLENTYDKTKIGSYLLRTYCLYFMLAHIENFDFRAKTLHKCIPILYTAISMTSLVEQSLVQPSDMYSNIRSVVEFQRWWILKSKLFAQKLTCLIPTTLNHLWFSVDSKNQSF